MYILVLFFGLVIGQYVSIGDRMTGIEVYGYRNMTGPLCTGNETECIIFHRERYDKSSSNGSRHLFTDSLCIIDNDTMLSVSKADSELIYLALRAKREVYIHKVVTDIECGHTLLATLFVSLFVIDLFIMWIYINEIRTLISDRILRIGTYGNAAALFVSKYLWVLTYEGAVSEYLVAIPFILIVLDVISLNIAVKPVLPIRALIHITLVADITFVSVVIFVVKCMDTFVSTITIVAFLMIACFLLLITHHNTHPYHIFYIASIGLYIGFTTSDLFSSYIAVTVANLLCHCFCIHQLRD